MKPRPSKLNPKDAASNDQPVLSLLRKIQSGEIHPSNLSTEDRQAVVEHLSAEGYSVAEMAEILKTSERTVARDRKTIREANAVARDPALVEQMVGQLFHEAQNCICRIRRAARDKEAVPAVRIDAEHRIYLILSDLTQRMQGLGYLPSAAQKIQAQVALTESEDPEQLQAEIVRLLKIGIDVVDGDSAPTASALQGLNQVLQLLPASPSSSTDQAPSQQENEHGQSK